VTSIVLTSLFHGSTTPRPYIDQNQQFKTGNVVYYNGNQCRWTRNLECAETFEYKGVDYQGCSIEDHKNRGWCSVDRKFSGNWHNCHLMCNINGKEQIVTGPMSSGVKGPVDQAPHGNAIQNFFNGLTGGRRLESSSDKKHNKDDTVESDRFLVEFTPEALHYKVDKDLIKTLVERQAFRGIEDGRERQLGEAKIVAFRLHEGDSKPSEDDSDMITIGPEQKFEADLTHHDEAAPQTAEPKEGLQIAQLLSVAGLCVLGVAALVAGIHRVRRSSQVQPYDSVESESEAAPTE